MSKVFSVGVCYFVFCPEEFPEQNHPNFVLKIDRDDFTCKKIAFAFCPCIRDVFSIFLDKTKTFVLERYA